MTNVLLAFSTEYYCDLAERPGRSKLEKQKAAKPRMMMQIILERLARDMGKGYSTSHLRADLLEEPLHTLRLYEPDSLAVLLENFGQLTRIPASSVFATQQPFGYIAVFQYRRVGWAVLAAYLEMNGQPILVFLRVMDEKELIELFEKVAANRTIFDKFFKDAEDVANGAT